MDLLLATRNQHKTQEFRQLLGREFNVVNLSTDPKLEMPNEIGSTFTENAILKAVHISKNNDLPVIADDSGLEVHSIEGAPGIYSARYAGENATDKENIDKLLSELRRRNVPIQNWTARFRCVIALAQAGTMVATFEGAVEGIIVDPPRGRSGFGYDPVFQPNGCNQTFAEMPCELKNEISHRAKAVAALREALPDFEN